MAAVFPLPKRIAKTTLSQYLRTKCDRQLFLSLHQPKLLAGAGLPEPMPARPGVGVLQHEGKSFEEQRNEKLIAAFGASVIFQKDASGKVATSPLDKLVAAVSGERSILLQGKVEPKQFRTRLLDNLAIPAATQAIIPPLDGLIPDIVVVRDAVLDEEEVTPAGGRRRLTTADAARRALVVIDVKHTSEANPSYSAEVALYAVVLANWLVETGLHAQYFVSVKCALWTRFKEGESAFDLKCAQKPPAGAGALLDALMEDCEDANLRFYLPTVLRFFREDLPRVIALGDAKPDGWQALEWHVDSRCSSCDFLGYARWVPDDFKKLLAAKPTHYCYPAADLAQHLSRIAGMTRGGRKTLHTASIHTTKAIAATSGTEPVYAKHTFLKKEGAKLPARANALAANALSVDAAALLATLAPWPQLSLAVAVNFDPSSGLLTGLGLGGRATAYVTGQKQLFWKHVGFVVDQKSLDAEWTELKSFLSTLSDYIEQANTYVTGLGKGPLKGQIAFWEQRQFQELCNAVGRHLPKVLALADKKQRALAWMFPPDELLEKEAGAVPPCVVFIDEIVRRVVFAPVPHVITLFDTAEHYHSGSFAPVERDAFYREFLTNGIPRERIYEIWSNEKEIVRGKVTKTRNSVVSEYIAALSKQAASISSVTDRLLSDFKGNIKSSNPVIDLSNPAGAKNVAFDAKLWIWWDKLGLATDKAAAHQRLALDGQALEATYDALRLYNGKRISGTQEWVFDVRTTSTEAKLDAGDSYLTVGLDGSPGYPLSSASDHLPSPRPPYAGDIAHLTLALNYVVRASLIALDRVARRAQVRMDMPPGLLQYLLNHHVLDLSADIFLTKAKPTFDWSKTSTEILRIVGNPPIAVPDPASATAMGAPAGAPGTSAVTPLAELLWAAPIMQTRQVMPAALALALANKAAAQHALNPSQRDAVTHALERSLTIVWGPPGTGKTNTLAAYVQSLVANARGTNSGIKILLAGPTYKAVEELVNRVVKVLDVDPTCACDLFVAYSQGQTPMTAPPTAAHLRVTPFRMNEPQLDALCLPKLSTPDSVTIVATGVMQSQKFAEKLHGRPLAPVFDVVIVDESSQVEVTRALAPFAVLKAGGRGVVAGDHLQMPPIAALEPPEGAEHLVGSIQSYLLHRNFGNKVTSSDLTDNYRSNNDIVAYARSIGYPAALKAHYGGTSLHAVKSLPQPGKGYEPSLPWWPQLDLMVSPQTRVMTLLHDDDLSSQGNEVEASLVAAIVWSLRSTVSASLDGHKPVGAHAAPTPDEFWGRSVGIVTPHRAQRALVVRELTKLFPGEAKLIDEAVDTVEKFQGGERHAIIVSFGVADADVIAGEEAFLMQLQRTNVAISRAQAKCIVVMPTTLAGHVPQDKKALLTAHAIKDYVDDFCDQEMPVMMALPGGGTRSGKLRMKS